MSRIAIAASIVLVLSTLSVAAQEQERTREKAGATIAQLRTISDAIEAYLTDYPSPPKAVDMAALAKALEGSYVKELPRTDAWGTPFRYEVDENGYRLVSAGADRKFDPSTWAVRAHTADANADAVVSGGAFIRTWDFDAGQTAAQKAGDVATEVGRQTAIMDKLPEDQRMPYFWKWSTLEQMKNIAAALERYKKEKKHYPVASTIESLKASLWPDYIAEMRTSDLWDTSLRYSAAPDGTSYVLVSAGSDKTFRQESWKKNGEFESTAEDAVIRDGKMVRSWKMPE